MSSTTERAGRSREIDPDEKDIPAGWPRPFYMQDGKRNYTQWSSDRAEGQIFECSTSKTYRAAKHHLCSSCGSQMEKGLIFDSTWVMAQAELLDEEDRVVSEGLHTRVRLHHLGEEDTHYGSPICYRCSLFALRHCPYFSAMYKTFGDPFTWVVTESCADYREFDDSSGLELINEESKPRITAGQVRTEVQAGCLHLTGKEAADFESTRPPAPRVAWNIRDQWDPTRENPNEEA